MSVFILNVKIKSESSDSIYPEYKTQGASGMDLCSIQDVDLQPGRVAMVSTGLSFEIPDGFEGQVRPRSGMAAKYSVTVLNAPGTIDADFRGIVQVILINHGHEVYRIRKGDRIAQLVFVAVERAKLIVTNNTLSDTDRGAAGFGSTGV